MLGVQPFGPVAPLRVAELESTFATGPTRGVPQADGELPAGTGDAAGPPALLEAVGPSPRPLSERDAWVTLLSVPGLGPVTFTALLDAFGSAREVIQAASAERGADRLRQAIAENELESERGIGDAREPGTAGRPRRGPLGLDLCERICRCAGEPPAVADRARSLGLSVVTLEDPCYPERLRRVEMPPPLLFVRGSVDALSARRAVAVVGTRLPTDKGRLIAGWIGSALARAGAVVVSGLALGIDGAAHAAVVGEGLATVAVLGGGHARLFPAAHERLADAIVAAGGAVVAELPPDTAATRGTFPRRNRLVSGLSDATVVVEAGRRSGALITAGWALEQGRDCFLVPGPFDAPTSAGCHAFMRSFPGQTRVVCGIPELLEDLELVEPDLPTAPQQRSPSSQSHAAGPEAALAVLGGVERALADLLALGPATADELARRTSLPVAAVLSALTLLELRGFVTGTYGRYAPAGPLARWRGKRPAGSG
jgi:DNA processing protein